MASSSIQPYKNNTTTETFTLVSSEKDGASYKVAGRPLANPYEVVIQRKLTAPSKKSNDHVVLRIYRTEPNADTGILATGQVTLDISIPKDQTVITATVMTELISELSSLLNEATAMEATTANIDALIEGYDL